MESTLQSQALEEAALLFDYDFYRNQLPVEEHLNTPEEFFTHYLTTGWKDGLDPHPFFSTNFYLLQIPELETTLTCPLIHYFEGGYKEYHPHILFEATYYEHELTKNNVRSSGNPLLHYLTTGYRIANPHPLFDNSYYLSELNKKSFLLPEVPAGVPYPPSRKELAQYLLNGNSSIARSERAPIVHFLTEGHTQGINPHPLFSISYYRKQGYTDTGNPVCHYLLEGHKQGLEPHPLFLSSYLKEYAEYPDTAILVEYLLRMAELNPPHPLFDYELYKTQLDAKAIKPSEPLILHYVKQGYKDKLTPTVLFDPYFYETLYPEYTQEFDDPFSQYIASGLNRGLHPHPFIDIPFIKKQEELPDKNSNLDLLLDITVNYQKYCTKKTAPGVFGSIIANTTILEAWLLGSSASFLEALLNLSKSPEHDSLHKHFINEHVVKTNSRLAERSNVFPRYQMIIYQHDTRINGVTKINLAIGNALYERGIECLFISQDTDMLDKQYLALGSLLVLSQLESKTGATNITALLLQLTRRLLCAGLINGLDGNRIAPYLKLCQIPTTFLLNESLHNAKTEASLKTFSLADMVIFPSNFTRKTYAKLNIPHYKIIPTAVTQPDAPSACASIVRKKHYLPTDARIILAVGVPVERKQPQLFIEVARKILKVRKDCYFIWLGGDKQAGNYFLNKYTYAHEDIESRVLFVETVPDPAPYYAAADILIHTSLNDPFPGVIPEALAAGIPVVAFSESTGSEELFEDEQGVLFVERAATDQMASKVLMLLNEPAVGKTIAALGQDVLKTKLNPTMYIEQLLAITAEQLEVGSIGANSRTRVTSGDPTRSLIFVTPNWQLSGVNTVLETLVRHLEKKDWDARILITGNTAVLPEHLPRCSYEVLHTFDETSQDARRNYFMHYLNKFDSAIITFTFDHITAALSSLIPSHYGIIGMLQSDEDLYYETAYRLGRYWNRMVSVSKHIADTVAGLNPSFTNLNETIFNSTIAQAEIPEPRTSPPVGPLSLLYAGRFENSQKNIDFFIPLVRTLEAMRIPFSLTLAGATSAAESNNIRTALSGHINIGSVVITPRLSSVELEGLYKQSDIFILPSRYEGFPLSLVEAMAYGCVPVCAAIESGIPELIHNQVNGFIFPQDSSADAANFIKHLHEQRTVLTTISQCAQETIRSHYTADKMAAAYAEMYQQVALELTTGYQRPPDLAWQRRYALTHYPFC